MVGFLGDFSLDWFFDINWNVHKITTEGKEKNNWPKNSHFDDLAMFIDFYSAC